MTRECPISTYLGICKCLGDLDPLRTIPVMLSPVSCAVSTQDFPPSRDGSDPYLLLNDKYVVTARPTEYFPPGCISLSDPQRTWCEVGLRDIIKTELYDPFSHGAHSYLGSLDVEVGFASLKKITETPYDQDVLADEFIKLFENQIRSESVV